MCFATSRLNFTAGKIGFKALRCFRTMRKVGGLFIDLFRAIYSIPNIAFGFDVSTCMYLYIEEDVILRPDTVPAKSAASTEKRCIYVKADQPTDIRRPIDYLLRPMRWPVELTESR